MAGATNIPGSVLKMGATADSLLPSPSSPPEHLFTIAKAGVSVTVVDTPAPGPQGPPLSSETLVLIKQQLIRGLELALPGALPAFKIE